MMTPAERDAAQNRVMAALCGIRGQLNRIEDLTLDNAYAEAVAAFSEARIGMNDLIDLLWQLRFARAEQLDEWTIDPTRHGYNLPPTARENHTFGDEGGEWRKEDGE